MDKNRPKMLSFTASVLPNVLPDHTKYEDLPDGKAPLVSELSRLEALGLVARGRPEDGGLITFNADLGDDEGKIDNAILVDLFGTVPINNLVHALQPSRHWHPSAHATVDRDCELDSTLSFAVLTKEQTKLVTAGSVKNRISIDILRQAATPSGRKRVDQTLFLGKWSVIPFL